MVVEKDSNGVEQLNTNVVVSEPQAIYVELKNDNTEALRYIHPSNGPSMRYEMPEPKLSSPYYHFVFVFVCITVKDNIRL